MRRLSTQDVDFAEALQTLLRVETVSDPELVKQVEQIIAAVRARGDAELLALTQRFDHHPATAVRELVIAPDALKAAYDGLEPVARGALDEAATRIEAFHQHQVQPDWQFIDGYGNTLGQKVTPLDRVGIYVPGGKASYPSSVLMNAIPAKVAGVPEIIMVVPAPLGQLNPLVLAAAYRAGVDRVFSVGGAQAIAALAYGTQTVPAVDKITGPGNRYVAAAKRAVFGQVGIDMIAGPSEILIYAEPDPNNPQDADWLAMDLLSQAEHDEVAQALLISTDTALLDRVAEALIRQLEQLPKAQIARASIRDRGALIAVRDRTEALGLINQIAAEHVELAVDDPEALVPKIRHAGAIFMGRHSPEAIGDYCAGPNHVLPTSGTARFSSPLGVYDFQKRSSLIGCTPTGSQPLARIADVLAQYEGLEAHARSARFRSDAQ